MDAFYAGDLLRACNLNPTLKTITKVGGEAQKGTKMLNLNEIYPMYQACKDSKDQGGFHDFVEILKLYDKMNENTMLGCDLFQIPLARMGVLAPGSAHARPSAQPPINTSGNFPAHMSAESPSNISPNPLEVISEVSEP